MKLKYLTLKKKKLHVDSVDTTSPCEPKASIDKSEKIERKSKTHSLLKMLRQREGNSKKFGHC